MLDGDARELELGHDASRKLHSGVTQSLVADRRSASFTQQAKDYRLLALARRLIGAPGAFFTGEEFDAQPA
jgi:ribose 5-phosphate isomerase RpiB